MDVELPYKSMNVSMPAPLDLNAEVARDRLRPPDDPVAKPAPLLLCGILETVARLREHVDANEPEPTGKAASDDAQ